jgi:uncharacterized protein (DUF1501 family)
VSAKKLAVPSRRAILGTGLAALTGGRLSAFGAGSADRVLVCIYLFGGSDTSMIVPLEQSSSSRSVRGGLGIPADSLLPVRGTKSQALYGFHPALSELRDLFESRALAVIGNNGARQLTESDKSLGYLPDGFAAPGWAVALSGGKSAFTQFAPGSRHNTRGGASLIALGGPSGDQLAQVVQSSLRSELSLQTQFPEAGLGSQLRQIAKVISLSGVRQQIYLCPLGGFTAGPDQLSRHEALFRELSPALAAFYEATVELGIDRRVTTFTDAAGGHQFALGGSVVGGDVTQSVTREQYSAALAKWFGIDASSLNRLFPALGGMTPPMEFLS